MLGLCAENRTAVHASLCRVWPRPLCVFLYGVACLWLLCPLRLLSPWLCWCECAACLAFSLCDRPGAELLHQLALKPLISPCGFRPACVLFAAGKFFVRSGVVQHAELLRALSLRLLPAAAT